MGFDEDIDQLKRELQTPKLDASARRLATANLCQKLTEAIQSRRLEFTLENGADPFIGIIYRPSSEKLASVFINEDSSITFQSQGLTEGGEEEFEDIGYFPPFVEYYDEREFLEEATEMLKQGLAEYELDLEEGDR